MMGVPQRLDWQIAVATVLRVETPRTKSISFEVKAWPGHLAGQHVDIRLTADGGYQAQRSYSVASPAGRAREVELTVERISDGEVSPFLIDELRAGDSIELRGPIGGYFTWDPSIASPLMLIAGGSGVVPLMSMVRTRYRQTSKTPTKLLYSSRTAEDIIYRNELDRLAEYHDGFTVAHTLTRTAPVGWEGKSGRVDRVMLAEFGFQPPEQPQIFVCGPTLFVEAVADHLIRLGHHEGAIKTERFGPTGDKP
jgi:ferredoxin-NADP reductase